MLPTTAQWLDLMAIVADQKWHLTHSHRIRNRRGVCPICAIANEIAGAAKFRLEAVDAARWIRGNPMLAPQVRGARAVDEIILAADNHWRGNLRRAMLAILRIDAV